MPAGALSRGLAVLQCLVGSPEGLPLTRIAEAVDLPKSAAHRILVNLVDEGFARQHEPSGNYALTLRIVSLGLKHLASSTIFELAVPVLARLATESGQLVRLGLVDGEQLLWVAKSQGSRAGLRYDPDHGSEVPFASTASGVAWLSGLSDNDALRLVARQDFDERYPAGHNAPTTLAEVQSRIQEARERGWARVHDSVEEGISAMATPLIDPDTRAPLGVVSIAGPSLQLTDERMETLAPRLAETAAELSGLAGSLTQELRSRNGFGTAG
ncbi:MULTISPECIES: IclR family transcriptional regulator [unclassified Amycolatopsis]|uniref:IclR family transcriptional regulator n=1 Tax=unclassified Amycolatopsis TaxID=2618356 RepID=UPI001C6A05B1|nr:IclR family transcriptional regulator [Amycolatopsis sp. DSM 110486]QYN20483.1 IclR family transcriptional regulator [Amycolatopsis sp. DSM 110486]